MNNIINNKWVMNHSTLPNAPAHSKHRECCEDSPAPDNVLFKRLATIYASNNPVMRTGHNCNETFPDGITNGAYWYELNGKSDERPFERGREHTHLHSVAL